MNEQENPMFVVPPRNDESPRWLTESYQGMEEDIKEWLYAEFFHKFWDGKPESLRDISSLSKSNAEARYKALIQTGKLRGAFDRSVVLQLYHAHKTGWYHFYEEIEDVKELLEHMYEDAYENDPSSSSRYEFEFLVKTLIPTLEEVGVKKELIIMIPQNIGKARAAIPVLRQIIVENQDDKEEKLVDVLQNISDPNITFRQFKALQQSKSISGEMFERGTASMAVTQSGYALVITASQGVTNAVLRAIRGMIDDPEIKDPVELLKYVTELVLPRKRDRDGKISSEDEGGS